MNLASFFKAGFFFGWLLLSACSWSGQSGQKLTDSYSEQEQAYREEFAQKSRQFLVKKRPLDSNLRQIELQTGKRSSLLWQGENSASQGYRLSLNLGKQLKQANGALRTTSRYELSNGQGDLLATAESVLDAEGLQGDLSSASLAVAFDEESQALLIAEEHSWAVSRLILMRLDGSVRFVYPPSRNSLSPVRLYRVVDFRDGAVWIRQDDQVFAFPFSEMEEVEDLSFSPG